MSCNILQSGPKLAERMAEAGFTAAVALPCFNEEVTIAKCVKDFQAALPGVKVFVFDNGSTDSSAELAREAGAEVIPVRQKGKGRVIREILAQVDADAILVADSDDTYPAEHAPDLILPVFEDRADMAVGDRLSGDGVKGLKPLNLAGNRLFVRCINLLFFRKFKDVLSGYRVFSRKFARQINITSSGFEIETELTLRSIRQNIRVVEVPVGYNKRPEGSVSKLNSWRDGLRIIRTIILFRFGLN